MGLRDSRKSLKIGFNRLDTIPACDSQPPSHIAVASTALCYASRGKNKTEN